MIWCGVPASPSLREALATKQSIFPLARLLRDGLLRFARNDVEAAELRSFAHFLIQISNSHGFSFSRRRASWAFS
jgi:hypothetical protein